MIKGLDVSKYQGQIDWSSVPKEFVYVFIKTSEGMTTVDPMALANLAGARASGRIVGVYHFCHPGDDVTKETAEFWGAIGVMMTPLPPAIDIETAPDSMTPKDLATWIASEASAVYDTFGRYPIIYTYPWFWESRVVPGLDSASIAVISQCHLWMADLSHGESPAEGSHPVIPKPFDGWCLWQTSGNNSSHVLGIGGGKVPVDHDVFNGDELTLRSFFGMPPPTIREAPTLPPPPPSAQPAG